jgi:sec-independent protein translocase protein TatB
MFNIGSGEFLGLFILAVILVGPERMPRVASDAAKLYVKLRNLAQGLTQELRSNLGPGYEDLDVKDLHPKTFIKKHITSVVEQADSPVKEVKEIKKAVQLDPDIL